MMIKSINNYIRLCLCIKYLAGIYFYSQVSKYLIFEKKELPIFVWLFICQPNTSIPKIINKGETWAIISFHSANTINTRAASLTPQRSTNSNEKPAADCLHSTAHSRRLNRLPISVLHTYTRSRAISRPAGRVPPYIYPYTREKDTRE